MLTASAADAFGPFGSLDAAVRATRTPRRVDRGDRSFGARTRDEAAVGDAPRAVAVEDARRAGAGVVVVVDDDDDAFLAANEATRARDGAHRARASPTAGDAARDRRSVDVDIIVSVPRGWIKARRARGTETPSRARRGDATRGRDEDFERRRAEVRIRPRRPRRVRWCDAGRAGTTADGTIDHRADEREAAIGFSQTRLT